MALTLKECWEQQGGVPEGSGDAAKIQGLECIFLALLQIVVRLAGIAAFIMLLVGGFQYLTSGGNPENTKKAQATLTWGIGGLAVLILAWLILKFIQTFTGINVSIFEIPGS